VLQTIITSILAFVSTNIDDVFLLMVFYGSKRYTQGEIVGAQYIGLAAIVGISFAGSSIGSFFDPRYIGLLGLFPIYLAVRELFWPDDDDDDDDDAALRGYGLLSLAGVTIANGGDNIGVYIPLFTTLTIAQWVVLTVVFVLLIYPMCILAKYLAGHPLVARSLNKYSHLLMPIVLFLLGVFILYETESWSLFFR
jgi:cadmium resistance protein CadD (predicted permease)